MPRKLTCSCGCELVVPDRPGSRAMRCPACWRQLPVPCADEESQRARAAEPPPSPAKAPGLPNPGDRAGVESSTPPPTVEVVERGYELDAGKRRSTRLLGAALAGASLLNIAPAVMHVLEHCRVDPSQGVSPWACGLLLMGVIQLAYALFLVQLPDWSTAWIVTLLTLVIAAVYAMLLAVMLSSTAEGRIIHALRLSDLLGNGFAAAWCFAMLSVAGLLSYCSGRFAVRWRRVYESESATACSTWKN